MEQTFRKEERGKEKKKEEWRSIRSRQADRDKQVIGELRLRTIFVLAV
jgi:hypothetical protein